VVPVEESVIFKLPLLESLDVGKASLNLIKTYVYVLTLGTEGEDQEQENFYYILIHFPI